MFPHVTFLQLTLYDWFLVLAAISALVIARIYADKLHIRPRLQNYGILSAVAAILAGYGFAVLFQAVYNAVEEGTFSLGAETGATFYGGLIGGAGLYFALWFTLGRKLCGQDVFTHFGDLLGIAACAIAFAHGVGRIGCLFAGCCYGVQTDSWLGIYLESVGEKVVPTQLIEAVFLFLLFALLTFMLFRVKRVNGMFVYLTAYGAFRFLIEFWRDDGRGALIPGLSPSQVWSIVLFLLGAAMILFSLLRKRKLE